MSKEKDKPESENRVTRETLEDFLEGLRELATNGDEVLERMRSKGMASFDSTNYASALRGVVLVTRFISGAVGIVATAKAAKLLKIDDSDQSPETAQGKQIAAEAKEEFSRRTKNKKPS